MDVMMLTNNPFHLLTQRRFIGFFITQFLGAFNDNLYKNALLLLIAFGHLPLLWSSNTLINLSAGLFIFPFFLFSPLAGQLSDKYDKAQLMRIVKFIELFVMGLGVIGFYQKNTPLLLFVLFLMGVEATFFGPAKYSILPQHLEKNALLTGNGLVEMGTFLAILLGTILGGVLVGLEDSGIFWISLAVFGIASLGWFSSLFIPKAPAAESSLQINWNPFTEGWSILKMAKARSIVFRAILGISWFWLYGALFLSQIPNYVSLVLHANESVATLFLTALSVGLGIGSILCTKLCRTTKRFWIILTGAIGLSVSAIDLGTLSFVESTETLSFITFSHETYGWRILCDLIIMGICGGFYTVPLYTLLQTTSAPRFRSRIIAANNIMNAFFMVLSSLLAIALLKQGFIIPQLFLLMGLLNLMVVGAILYYQRPFKPTEWE